MLQKITLGFITIFFLITAGVGVLSYVYPPDYAQKPDSSASQTPITTNKPAAANNKPSGGLTYAEIAKHNKPEDCYLVIKGIVYDISYYANKHPGGQEAISSNCGKEVTGLFASIHSNFAWNLLSGYKIGVISANQATTGTGATTIQTATLPNGVGSGNENEYEDD